jgi:hypothetical protein
VAESKDLALLGRAPCVEVTAEAEDYRPLLRAERVIEDRKAGRFAITHKTAKPESD